MKKWLKVLIILISGLIVAVATFFINKSYISENTKFQSVVVAKETVTPYGKLEKYELAKKVTASIPEDAITALNYLQDKQWYAGSIGIGEGDVVRKSRLVDENNSPFGKAISLGPQKVLVGIETSLIQSAGANIKPGVLVNALVFKPGSQRGEPDVVISSDNDPRLGNLLVKQVQNSQAGSISSKGREAIPAVAVLETTIPVAKLLVMYQETGKIYLAPVGIDPNATYQTTSGGTTTEVFTKTPATATLTEKVSEPNLRPANQEITALKPSNATRAPVSSAQTRTR